MDCVVCMSEEKNVVFVPCGKFSFLHEVALSFTLLQEDIYNKELTNDNIHSQVTLVVVLIARPFCKGRQSLVPCAETVSANSSVARSARVSYSYLSIYIYI